MGESKPTISEAPEMVLEHPSPEVRQLKLEELRPFKQKLMYYIAFETPESLAFETFRKKLIEKYGDSMVENCQLIHFLRGSSLLGARMKDVFFDFAGEDSIEKFLRDNYGNK